MIIYSYEILVFISSRYQEEIILLITPTTVYIIATDLNFCHHWYKPTVNIAISSGNNVNNSFWVGDSWYGRKMLLTHLNKVGKGATLPKDETFRYHSKVS